MGGLPRGAGSDLFHPMLASPARVLPSDEHWVFEPKYDGIRIIALVTADAVALLTRNGHDKCRQFPEITRALRDLAKALGREVVLDGEVVALNARGEPARFQDLQVRMHLEDTASVDERSTGAPTAFVAFDVLIVGGELLTGLPWSGRRERLEKVMRAVPAAVRSVLRLSGVARGSADALLRKARAQGWEGIMAKRSDRPYEPGRRVRHWQKLKLENQREFVIGGWTEPRNSRSHFGALLLGYYDDKGRLVYAGHAGTGFSQAVLEEVHAKLKRIERATSPFTTTPRTNERAHWAAPKCVAEIRFNEWTAEGQLRHPVFLGLREDKAPRAVVREQPKPAAGNAKTAGVKRRTSDIVAQLRQNASAARASIQLGAETSLDVTNLGKLFFPAAKLSKGRLMEYYAEVAPYLLPALQDRPLVLKRYPNGIREEAFYQQKAPDKVPHGIRVEKVADDRITTQRRLIGGDLATLLYLVQLGAISTDPWHSRVPSIADADYSIVDLDPGPKATFRRVVQVARWVKEELDELGLRAVPKTSGASGIHIVLPLPSGASYEIAVALAELVARRVNQKHPKETTVHRWVKSRPPAAVYLDYLQNIRGKTVASVYSARAETHASVSAPLKWSEIAEDLHPTDFTIENMPARLKSVGDLWAAGMRKRNHLPGIVGDAAA